jgi:four helix bundle protein
MLEKKVVMVGDKPTSQETKKIKYHWEIDTYKLSIEAAMEIYERSKSFPEAEKYSLTDRIRKSSRSVSAQIAEGWRRRKYRAAFVNKMNEAEAKAAETQVWLEYAAKCQYISKDVYTRLHYNYQEIIGKLINMQKTTHAFVLAGNRPQQWCLS